MTQEQPNNPLHGITLKTMLEALVRRYGFAVLGEWLPIRCFQYDPSVASSLAFLRRTPWAREKLEAIYLETLKEDPESRD